MQIKQRRETRHIVFNVKTKSQGMKKILCMTMLMLVALTVSAMAQTKAASPPEQDIATPAAEVGTALVAYRWPGCKPECTTTDAITPTTCRTVAGAYPFMTAHTDRL